MELLYLGTYYFIKFIISRSKVCEIEDKNSFTLYLPSELSYSLQTGDEMFDFQSCMSHMLFDDVRNLFY